MESKVFDVQAAGLTLQFEFYTFESIKDDLEKIFKDQVKVYDMSIYKKWSQIRQDNKCDVDFFTYIKFFVEEEEKEKKTYGLIGGKTNYNKPDVSLHDIKENESRFGRLFIKGHNYKMSNKILVIHHKETKEDSMQAFFIERYVQRRYNLFDS